MNKVILIGNLTTDVELATTNSGLAVAKFSIAVNKVTNGERVADFFNIVAWRELAERCSKFLSKGKKVCVVGSIQNRSYEGQDGITKYITEILASEVEFLSPKSETDSGDNAKNYMDKCIPIDDDNVPF